jgi:hypothetical protein
VRGFLHFYFHYHKKVVTFHLGNNISNFSIIGKSFKTKVFLKIAGFKNIISTNNFHINTILKQYFMQQYNFKYTMRIIIHKYIRINE